MAWKVYGFMEGRDADKKRGIAAIFGPLPRKRWVAMSGDKKRRVTGLSNAFKAAPWDKGEQARKGIEYALWLAHRDGIEVPGGSPTAVWANVTLPTGKTQMRVSCVMFGGGASRLRIDIPQLGFHPGRTRFGKSITTISAICSQFPARLSLWRLPLKVETGNMARRAVTRLLMMTGPWRAN